MFNIIPLNAVDSSHVLNVNGTDIPFNDNPNVDPMVINLNAGDTVTAYIRYNSADFVHGGWSVDFGGGDSFDTDGNAISIKDLNGNRFNSFGSAAITVAGAAGAAGAAITSSSL